MKPQRLISLVGPVLMLAWVFSNRIHGMPLVRDALAIAGVLGMALLFASPAWSINTSNQDSEVASTCYAGLWFRFVAGIIDALMGGLISMIIVRTAIDGLGAAGYIADTHRRLADFGTSAEQWAVALVGYWIYSATMESSQLQATLGKLMLKLKVTDEDGHRISFVRASLRYWGKLVSIGTLLIGFLAAITSSRKQALHDLLVKTVVVEI